MADESAPEEGTDIRRKAAVRLGIAGLVTALALAGLWWLDHSGKEAPKSPAAPAPIVSAPAATPPAPPVEAAEPAATPDDGRQAPAEEAPAEPPPPPAPATHAPSAVAKPVAARPARAVEPAASAPAPLPAAGDYVVQLGVFSNPRNARELVERLQKQGIRAYTETRVQVGPFKDRTDAERAQAELKRMGISGLVGTTK